MKPIGDLLQRVYSKKSSLSERGELIKYFVEQTGKKPQQIAVRLAHYTMSELYALKSAYNDRLRRNGKEAAQKYWWWQTKTTKV